MGINRSKLGVFGPDLGINQNKRTACYGEMPIFGELGIKAWKLGIKRAKLGINHGKLGISGAKLGINRKAGSSRRATAGEY